MAGNINSSSLFNQIENIVREVVNHPRFQSAVNNYDAVPRPGQSSTSSDTSCDPSTSCNNQASSSTSSAGPAEDRERDQQTNVQVNRNNNKTPREEFSMLFRTGANRNQPAVPAFQRLTTWGPQPRSRSTSSATRKKTPYSSTSSTKTKPVTKPLTFSREVVLLNNMNTKIPRGKAKAELQRTGNILSSFAFSKLWSAVETIARLKEAFSAKLGAGSTNTPNFKIMMGMGNELVEPQLTSGQELSGDMIARIFTQRTIWLQLTSNAEIFDSIISVSDEEDDLKPNVLKIQGLDGMANDKLLQLKEMFPNIEETVLSSLLKEHITVNNVIDVLMADTTKNPDYDAVNTQDLMVNHRLNADMELIQKIKIDREELWADSIATFKDPKFNVNARPRVSFIGECGIDAGGLRREYATLLRQQIFSSSARLFEGTDKRKLPIFSVQAIQSRLFFLAGKMISYNIFHQDVGIPCLSPAFYTYMATGSIGDASSFCRLDDIPDYDVKEWITQVSQADSMEAIQECQENSELVDILTRSGWLEVLNVDNKALAMQSLLINEVLAKRKEVAEQLFKGLESVGILSLIRSHPDLMRPYFVNEDTIELTSDCILSLLTNIHVEIDCQQKNKARKFLIQAVKELESRQGSVGLKKFLHYLTGLDSLPPLGIQQEIHVEYVEGDHVNFFAETCLMNLRVPTIHSRYAEFNNVFQLAVDNNTGFGSI